MCDLVMYLRLVIFFWIEVTYDKKDQKIKEGESTCKSKRIVLGRIFYCTLILHKMLKQSVGNKPT